MELNELKAFIEVATRASFSRAAEHLFLTQPAISKRIATLEKELGAALFDRIGRGVALTEAGQVLLPSARRVLQELEMCRHRIQDLRGRVGGRLSIATSHHVGLHHLPPALRRFSTDYPDVELDLHFMDSEVACRAVEAAELELAVVTLPSVHRERLLHRVLWPDPLDLVVGRDHPLAQAGDFELSLLAQYPAILPAHGTFTRQIVEQALGEHRISLKVALESNYLETIRTMVSVGLGWSVLPRSMLGADLLAVGRDRLGLRRDLGLVRHRDRSLTRAAEAFVALLTTPDPTGIRPADA